MFKWIEDQEEGPILECSLHIGTVWTKETLDIVETSGEMTDDCNIL